jgi:hypothetical protein
MVVNAVLLALQLQSPSQGVDALVQRARAARFQQDAELLSYNATVRQRGSAGIGVAPGLTAAPISRVRLAARIESVARVGWHRELGAWGEIIAARAVAPIVGEMTPEGGDDEEFALTLPYYPGRDRLWPMSELREALPGHETWIEHPLDAGADSLYEFSPGDSISMRLPDTRTVWVREVRVRPRRPDSRLIVGSLWIDVASGALVRAAYRPSMPLDLWPFFAHEIGNSDDRSAVKKFGPYTGIVREVIVEHGLYEGRFWLPRTRIADAEGTAKGARVTMSIAQTFTYQGVRAVTSPTPITLAAADVDSATGRKRYGVWSRMERRTRRCREKGDTSSRWEPDSLLRDDDLSVMTVQSVRFRVLMPCRRRDLVTSPELPGSIYDAGEELFTDTDLGALRKDVEHALSLSSQAKWQPQPAVVQYGLTRGLLRYNRIEGLSAAVRVERVLGSGYTQGALARIGTADLEPNGELYLQRASASTDVRVTAYRRLVAANDWGAPLGPGASLLAALFARDDGFYYRSFGAELTGTRSKDATGSVFSWRLFAERQDSASVETQLSLAKTVSGTRFQPNIGATEGTFAGGSATAGYAWGSDPRGTQLTGGVRAEAATGEHRSKAYARVMLEQSLIRGFGERTRATLMLAAGAAAGTLPPQRLWYLGGAQTVRGYVPGAEAGNAFWLGRVDLSTGHPLFRPSVFGDVGWAGPREDWSRDPQLLEGAGIGIATFDGLLRLDVARSLTAPRRWRAEFYLEVR